MNDMSPPENGTALALVLPAQAELEVMLKTENGMDATIASLKAAARAKVAGADVNTAKGRELMKSAAFDLSKSKAEIERRAKELTERQRKEVAAVNAGVKSVAFQLDAERDEIKRPAIEWEAAEAERKARITEALDHLRNHGMTADAGSIALAEKIRGLTGFEITEEQFGDQTEQAQMVRETTVRELRNLLAAPEKAEADARELADLRAAKAAQEAKEAEDRAAREAEEARQVEDQRQEREAREQAEREEAARKAAAEELATRAKNARAYIEALSKDTEKPLPVIIHLLETDLVPKINELGEHAEAIHQLRLITLESVRQRAKIAEQARKDAEAQHQREAEEAARQQAEKAATEAAERAAQQERDRIAAEQQAQAEAKAKREADQAHLTRIEGEIATDLNGFVSEGEARLIAAALMAGDIRNCEVRI